ncbi:MAG: hypothetical protein OXH76_06250 [Boseongicola sp.]|nr:hypothetical protein [Boseongicola sp.]
MKRHDPILQPAPLALTRRAFSDAVAMPVLVPAQAGLAQSRPPGFTFFGHDASDPQAWADALRLDPESFAPGQFE